MTTQVESTVVTLTPTAIQAVQDLLKEKDLGAEYALRVYVAGRTCSGLQYGMALDNNPQDTDTSFEADGVRVLVDEISIQHMQGATLDFIDDERGQGFMVTNPNTAPSCSCESGSCG
ncbi:MAG: iron-sulfur cluster assembly accessory protein [Chloroflexota bacterium]